MVFVVAGVFCDASFAVLAVAAPVGVDPPNFALAEGVTVVNGAVLLGAVLDESLGFGGATGCNVAEFGATIAFAVGFCAAPCAAAFGMIFGRPFAADFVPAFDFCCAGLVTRAGGAG